MPSQNNQVSPIFEIPKEVKITTKSPIYINNRGESIGQVLFRPDGSVGVYVEKEFFDRISRSVLDRRLKGNYKLGILKKRS